MNFLKRAHIVAALAASLAAAMPATQGWAQASDTACLGQLMLFGGNFCPRGWTEAAGGTLNISQNTALFSIYGTMYGGNGTTNFGIPDLRGRAPLGQGNGPNLPPAQQGALVGAPTVTLTQDQLAPHSHALSASGGPADSTSPNGTTLAGAPIFNSNVPNVSLGVATIGKTGVGAPIAIQSPSQVIRWCIATEGVFCPRQ